MTAKTLFAWCVAAAVTTASVAAPRLYAAQASALKIIVLEGEDAVNLIDKKTAVKPTVEVRDRNDLPVAGALVRFAIRGRAAAFNNGVREISLTTDSLGRATVSELTPLGKGAIQIQVNASYQGQTAAATIHQTNFATVAQAAQAGKVPAQSGQSATSGSTGTTTATTTAGGAAGGAGGGLSGLAVAGIVGGAAAGTAAGVAVVRSRSGNDVPAPTVSSISISPTGAGIVGATTFSFSAQGTNAASGETFSYTYDFGDGTTGTGVTATHQYNSAGTYTIRVTASNSRNQTATATATVTVVTLSARWFGNYPENAAEGGAGTFTITSTQTGRTLSGTFVDRRNNGLLVTCAYAQGTVGDAGRIQFGPMTGCVNSGSTAGNLIAYNGYQVTGTMDATGNQITVSSVTGLTLTRQ